MSDIQVLSNRKVHDKICNLIWKFGWEQDFFASRETGNNAGGRSEDEKGTGNVLSKARAHQARKLKGPDI